MKTKFQDFKNLDLRRIGSVVLCVKNYNKSVPLFGGRKNKYNFKKDNYYKVNGFFGDPQGALEAGINDYLPVEFISRIIILDERKKECQFELNIKGKYMSFSDMTDNFFEYFEIPEFSENIDKFNV